MRAGEEADEALMLRYRDGDSAAFEALYRRHRGPLLRYLVRQLRDRATAEEAFQDVWANLIRARQRYEVRAKFTTWLYRMARNRSIDLLRCAQRSILVPANDDAGDPVATAPAPAASEPDRSLETQRKLETLKQLIEALPDEQREAFLLREEGGLGIEEIAQITGVGNETAKSRLRYAVAKLRRALDEPT